MKKGKKPAYTRGCRRRALIIVHLLVQLVVQRQFNKERARQEKREEEAREGKRKERKEGVEADGRRKKDQSIEKPSPKEVVSFRKLQCGKTSARPAHSARNRDPRP